MEDYYQLVILGSDWDLYKMSYSDIISDKVRYIDGYKPQNQILRFAYKAHLTPKLNRFIHLPFKPLWNKLFFKNIDRNAKVVFLVFQNWLSIDTTIHTIDYIKKTYKNGKIVLFLQDIVSSFVDIYKNRPVDIVQYKKKCDAIITFDKKDSKKFGFLYHSTVFSHIPISVSDSNKFDVFFIGKYKGRLDLLVDIYIKLSSCGLKCKFIVLNAPIDKRKMSDKIEYIDHILSYKEVLQLVNDTKCILEILQPGAVGYTYRLWESISYNKFLLSNNHSLLNSEFFDKKYISIFSSAEDIDMSFMQRIDKPSYELNPNSKKISPYNLIEFIELQLNVKIQL